MDHGFRWGFCGNRVGGFWRWLEGLRSVREAAGELPNTRCVCLGATAAQTLLGAQFRLTKHRGEFMPSDWAPWLLATNHPGLF